MVRRVRIQAFEGGFIEFFEYSDDDVRVSDHDVRVVGGSGDGGDEWSGAD